MLGYKKAMCAKCGGSVHGDVANIRRWMLSECGGTEFTALLFKAGGQPVKVPAGMQIQVASKTLHSSHDLYVYKHLYFCNDCGKVAGLRVVQLGGACVPVPKTTTGVRNLRRIRQGLLPYGTPFWPSDVSFALRGHTIQL